MGGEGGKQGCNGCWQRLFVGLEVMQGCQELAVEYAYADGKSTSGAYPYPFERTAGIAREGVEPCLSFGHTVVAFDVEA